MLTFGEKVLRFNSTLEYRGLLPNGVHVMNPFKNSHVQQITQQFYSKFFNDSIHRILILGINPGRFGAGATGIPFTDTIRLNEKCGIIFDSFRTYEPSSAFIYEMIEAFGSVHEFYRQFLISAVCPLGFTIQNPGGKDVNFNYYDSRELTEMVYNFIVNTMNQQLDFGINRDVCFCLGTGKNDLFLRKLNTEHRFFKSIVTLEHPRFIMQYRSKTRDQYINKYLGTLTAKHI
jgi:hypothetical protein